VPALTLTDGISSFKQLPPLVGLLDDTLEQAIRARQRRVFVIDHPGQRLAALRVMDGAIDQAVVAASIYGQDAIQWLEHKISQALGDERDAAVFLRLALAVQLQEQNIAELIARYAPEYARPVYEALRFSPVTNNIFTDRTDHLTALFEWAKHDTTLMPLALRLVGERDIKAFHSEIEPFLHHPELAPWAHYAWACIGQAGALTRQFVEEALASDTPDRIEGALRICAVAPALPSDKALEHGLSAPEAVAGTAWAILACRYPRRVYDYAMSLGDLAMAVKYRLVALTGFMDGMVAVCAALAARDGSITPAEADVLALALGAIPMEARCEPNDREAKSKALRALVLKVCRQSHITIKNDADICEWGVDHILADPTQIASVRIRRGFRMTQTVPKLDQAVLDVTHGLRQWLYIERAVYGGHVFALSAEDVSRRQETAMMVAEFYDAVQDQ